MNANATMPAINIVWMRRSHLPEVLNIEFESFTYPWDSSAFHEQLSRRNCIGMVAEHNDEHGERIAGFMIYELLPRRIHLLNFAVACEFWRHGIGTRMVDTLKRKLSPQHRRRIVLEVSEYNTRGQLFFRACGFRAEAVLQNHYEETPEDAYQMVYRFKGTR